VITINYYEDIANIENKKELWNCIKTWSVEYIPFANQYIYFNNGNENHIIQWVWEGHNLTIDLSKINKFVGDGYLNGNKDYIDFVGYDFNGKPYLYISRLDCSNL
jgi:hypothetical protein